MRAGFYRGSLLTRKILCSWHQGQDAPFAPKGFEWFLFYLKSKASPPVTDRLFEAVSSSRRIRLQPLTLDLRPLTAESLRPLTPEGDFDL